MEAPETAGAAAQRDAGGDPNFDRLGGAVDEHDNTFTLPNSQCEALGIDPTEVETALALCAPVVIHEPTWRRLHEIGITGDGMNGRRPLDALCVEEVVFLPAAHFEFCRDFGGYERKALAVIIPCRNEFGELTDLAAWRIETDELALWRGRASLLGSENVYAPRLGEPLKVYETVAGWLRSGRTGVFVIDGQRAEPLLRIAEPLGVRSEGFGRRLRDALTVRSPKIVVASHMRRVA